MSMNNDENAGTINLQDDDALVFVDEAGSDSGPGQLSATSDVWHILIADDEKDVHQATRFALRDTTILGRSLEFHSAYNTADVLDILKRNGNIAVIFLDVVMDTSNAGLDLVPVIREQLKDSAVRIILRTGEPNQAPELDVIRNYDINDYRLKSELTQSRLYTTLISAIRSYQQIRTIENSKKGLDLILRSSATLMTKEGLNTFSQGVIMHIAALLEVPPEGLICACRNHLSENDKFVIIAAAGDYSDYVDRDLNDLEVSAAQALLQESLLGKKNIIGDCGVALYLGSHVRGAMSCYIASPHKMSEVDQDLLEMFCRNISLCADNISFLERLRTYAFTDTLLGLPNRNALEEEIDSHKLSMTAIPYSLALIDIDNFAEINAVLGQDYGDRLLKTAAERIRNGFAQPNMVARVGGDTFAVFGPSSHINKRQLLQAFVNPFQIGSELQLLSATASVVALDLVKGGGSEAIKDASIALKQGKNCGRGEVIVYQRNMVTAARDRLELLKNLRAAFEQNQLFLMFQPKLRLKDLKVTGFEALIRWRDSTGQFIPPSEFIPLAEQSGLIIRMGEWILRSAIRELGFLREKGYTDVSMAVNLSVAQLQHPDFIEMLERVMGESEIPASAIELEVTESVAMGDMEENLERLRRIRAMGFKLSMDDFGTGFSSLTYLQQMPISCLKIDRSFVNTCNTESGRKIAEMIVQLGKTLGLVVIAEGVEEASQGELLKVMGCHEVQGFFYARPMPRDVLLQWLEENRSAQ